RRTRSGRGRRAPAQPRRAARPHAARVSCVRGLLIVNPHATSTTRAGRDLLAHALESRLDLEVVHTTHRGHASELAHRAALRGASTVIVHGGDGTVNEAVNGMLGPPNPGSVHEIAPGPTPAL